MPAKPHDSLIHVHSLQWSALSIHSGALMQEFGVS